MAVPPPRAYFVSNVDKFCRRYDRMHRSQFLTPRLLPTHHYSVAKIVIAPEMQSAFSPRAVRGGRCLSRFPVQPNFKSPF